MSDTNDPQAIRPDAIEQAEEATDDAAAPDLPGNSVSHPTKIIRIASMTRAMLEEVRQAPLDPAGRRRLLDVHERTLAELADILSDDLRQEFNDIFLPLTSDTPTESELRVAQAQLVGWLEGLFHGIQASLMSQQLATQAQLQDIQRRALEGGNASEHQYPGVYL